MEPYTIRNLTEVEDAAAKRGVEGVEARFAGADRGCEQVSVSHQRLAPGVRQPFSHHHGSHEELYVVLDGGGQMLLGDEVRPIRALDAIRVAPETIRAFEAGADGLEVLAIGPRGMTDAKLDPVAWPGV